MGYMVIMQSSYTSYIMPNLIQSLVIETNAAWVNAVSADVELNQFVNGW